MADERLEIQITAQVAKAVNSLDKLIGGLEKVNTALSSINASGLANFSMAMTNLANASNNSNASKNIKSTASAINSLSKAIKGVNGVSNFKQITQDLSNGFANLQGTQISSTVAQTTNAIARLVTALNGSTTIEPTQIDNIVSSVQRLTTGLQNVGASADISNFANSLGVLVNALNKVKDLGAVQTNLVEVGSALKTVISDMQGVHVSSELAQFTEGLGNIAKNSTKATTSLTKIKNKLDELSGSTDKATAKTKTFLERLQTFNSGVGQVTSAFGTVRNTINGIINAFKKLISYTSDYVETFNYFSVTLDKITSEFGEGSATIGNYSASLSDLTAKMTGYTVAEDGALEMANNVNLGQSISQIMQFESQIASITNATGMLGDSSIRVSETMTMLAVDLSSLWNIPVETAMTNLRSGLVGQTKALYKYGIDITNANLQQLAYTLGVNKSVTAMTQAEKMQLRVISVLQQSKVAWGDQANTLDTFANQMRIAQQQLQNTGMQIGALLLPIAQKVLIFFNAVLIAIQRIIQKIFSFFGIEWSSVLNGISDGYSAVGTGLEDLESDVEDLGSGLSDASSSAKELKRTLLGFDEINALNDNGTTGTLGGIGGGGVGGGDLDLSDALKDATEDYFKIWNDALAKAKNKAQELADIMEQVLKTIGLISAGLLTWKIAKNVSSFIAKLIGFSDADAKLIGKNIANKIGGAVAVTLGVIFYIKSWETLMDDNTLSIEGIAGAIATTIGLTAMGVPLMFSIPIGIALIVTQVITKLAVDRGNDIGSMLSYGMKNAMENAGIDAKSLLQDMFGEDYMKYVQALSDYANAHDIDLSGELNLSYEDALGLKDALKEVGFTTEDMLNSIGVSASNLMYNLDDNTRISLGTVMSMFGLMPTWYADEVLTPIEQLTGTSVNTNSGLWGWLFNDIITGSATVPPELAKQLDAIDLNGDGTVTYQELIWGALWESIKEIYQPVYDWFDEHLFTPIGNALEGIKNFFEERLKGMVEFAKEWFPKIASHFATVTALPIYNAIKTVASWFVDRFKSAWSSVKEILVKIAPFFNTYVKEPLINRGKEIVNGFINIINGFIGAFEWLVNFFIDGFNRSFVNSINRVIGVVENFADKLNIDLNVNYVPQIENISLGRLQTFASGGYDINSGEMFIARENGLTEMVGRIGNHTTVANNQQIVEGISIGVANANAQQNALLSEQNNLLRELIAKADNSGGGGGISTSEIVSALERTNTRNGRTIVALGV